MDKMMIQVLSGIVAGLSRKKDRAFSWLVCGAALLVVSSYLTERRPSDILATVAREFGFESAANGLSVELPPIVANENPVCYDVFARLTVMLVVWMAISPVVRVMREGEHLGDFDFEAEGLMGARAPGTVWILLLAAAQYGPIKPLIVGWAAWAFAAAVRLCIIVVLVILALTCLDRRIGHLLPLGVCIDGIKLVSMGAATVVVAVIASVALSSVGSLARVLAWWCATESDIHVDVKRRVAREMAQIRREPTGCAEVGEVKANRVSS
ncbi:hypothetical protein [Actinomyces procaprae]|uniref:hypothetical protein n=1 Tax=Actinomyces procaprae TaxID=2560010 RepID=UPI0010A2A5AD|nr:hypothetical protein [Actinomyces procaprae]